MSHSGRPRRPLRSQRVRRRCGIIQGMPSAPDFRLYHSNSLEVLAGLLVGVAGAVVMIRLAAPRPAHPRSGAVALVALIVVLALHGTRLDGEPMVRRLGETVVEQLIR